MHRGHPRLRCRPHTWVDLRPAGQISFECGGKTGAAAAPEPGRLHLFDHLTGFHLGQRFNQRLVAAGSNVMFDFGGVDPTAVRQDPALLLGIKRDLVAMKNRLEGFGHPIGQPVDQLVLFQGQADNVGGIVGRHFLILNTHRLNGDHRRFGAEAVTAGGANFDLTRETPGFDFVVQRFQNAGGSVSATAGHAHVHFDNAFLAAG
jgi:hypothetical protein